MEKLCEKAVEIASEECASELETKTNEKGEAFLWSRMAIVWLR